MRDATQRAEGNTQAAQANLSSNTRNKLLYTLEQLLAIEGGNVETTLDRASDLIADAVGADKIDVFLYEPASASLVAFGTSRTPMGLRQEQLGLDRLPVANAGPEVAVLDTGESYRIGNAVHDATVPIGVTQALGVRSLMIVPLEVSGERRGVLEACSAKINAFSEDDLGFLQAVAHWIGTLTHRAELSERIAEDATKQARRVVAEELITVLAHDLSNILTPLKARLSLVRNRIRRDGRDGRERDLADLEAATRAVNRLQGLTRDLLDVGRLDQGLFAITKQPMDLVALVRETSGVIGSLNTGQINVILSMPEELVVEADQARIGQAIENLISNALKHSPKGVPIDVDVQSETRHNDDLDGDLEEEWAIINVHDQGPGVPTELAPRLFNRFAPGPNSTGLGLGLYLARSIAEAHNGTLTLTSEPGKGTTFSFAFPTICSNSG